MPCSCCIKNTANLRGKLLAIVWLAEQLDAGVQTPVVHDGVLGIARGVEHAQIRMDLHRALGELTTSHARHDDIGEQ